MQFVDKEEEDTDEDLDFRALESGFVSSKRHFSSLCLILEELNCLSLLSDEVQSDDFWSSFDPTCYCKMILS